MHQDTARGRDDRARLVVPITHHQAPTIGIYLAGVRIDVRVDLSRQCRGQHPPGTLTHDLIEQRPRHHRLGSIKDRLLS